MAKGTDLMEVVGSSLLAGAGGHMAAKNHDLRFSVVRKEGKAVSVAMDLRTWLAGAGLAVVGFGMGDKTVQRVAKVVATGAGASLLTTEAVRASAKKKVEEAQQAQTTTTTAPQTTSQRASFRRGGRSLRLPAGMRLRVPGLRLTGDDDDLILSGDDVEVVELADDDDVVIDGETGEEMVIDAS